MRSLFLLNLVIYSCVAQVFPTPNFNCTANYPPPPATNVRQLRPGNINVIMALGDSITAGFAMQGFPPTDFLEWRDYVYSIGGASDAYTIGTCLQNFNPNLQGLAMGRTLPLTRGAYLDGGVSHASIEDVSFQIDYLVETMQTQYSDVIDFKNDWKLLTIFIGANNLCGSCKNGTSSQPWWFEQHLRMILTRVRQHIPRVFVNLIGIFNISGVWNAGQTSLYCRTLWDGITNGECGCLLRYGAAGRAWLDIRAQQFNAISEKVAAQFTALNDPEFTVVFQPGLTGLNITQWGEQYLSALDCFHPSLPANQAFTYLLWNNMFQPIGKKTTDPNINDINIICPGPDDFLQ